MYPIFGKGCESRVTVLAAAERGRRPEALEAETDFSLYSVPTLYRVHQKGFSFVCFKELLQTPNLPAPGLSGKSPVSTASGAFLSLLFPHSPPFYRGGREKGALPGVNLRAHLCRSQGSAHPSRGYRSPHGGQGLGHFVGTPVPPALSPPSGGHAPTPPPLCPRPPPEPGSGLAGSPTPGSLGPGARGSLPSLRPPLTWLAL